MAKRYDTTLSIGQIDQLLEAGFVESKMSEYTTVVIDSDLQDSDDLRELSEVLAERAVKLREEADIADEVDS